MAAKYELVDTTYPKGDPGRRAGRFNSLPYALRELAACVGVAGRFELVDRQTKAVIDRSKGTV